MRFRKILMIFVFVMLIGVFSGCNTHKHTMTEVKQVDATCTQEGVIHHFYCSSCNLYFSDKEGLNEIKNVTIAKVSHTYGDWVDHQEKCDEKGVSTHTCTKCGHEESKVIEATTHTYSDWVITKDATCTENGSKEKSCTKCDHKVTEEIAIIPHTYGDWFETRDYCDKEGEATHTCTKCDHKESKVLEAGEHLYNDWVITKEATCTENGSKEKSCTKCDHKETEEIAIIPHTYGDWVETYENCEKEGMSTHTCTKCNHEESKEIGPTEHTYGEWAITKDPTCILEGEKERECSKCGHKETEIIAKVNHTFENLECIVCGYDTFEYPELKRFAESMSNIDYTIKVNNLVINAGDFKVQFGEIYIKADNGNVEIYATLDLLSKEDILNRFDDDNYEIPEENTKYILIIKDHYAYAILIRDDVIDQHTEYPSYTTEHYENYNIIYCPESGLSGDVIGELLVILEALSYSEYNLDINTNKKVCQVLDYIFNGIFAKTKQDDKIIYELSSEKLITLNNTLYSKSISQIIDELFGEGTYDNLDEEIITLLNTEVGDLVVMLEEQGIDFDKLDTIITEILSLSDVDFHELINGSLKEFLTSDEIKHLKPIDIIMSLTGIETKEEVEGLITESLRQLKDKTLYQIIGGFMDFNDNDLEQLNKNINELLGHVGKEVKIMLVTSLKGEFIKLSIKVNLGNIFNIDVELLSGNNLEKDYQTYIDKCLPLKNEQILEIIYKDCAKYQDSYSSISNVIYNEEDNTLSYNFDKRLHINYGEQVYYLVNTYKVTALCQDIEVGFHPICENTYIVSFSIFPSSYELISQTVYIGYAYEEQLTDGGKRQEILENNIIEFNRHDDTYGYFCYDFDTNKVLEDAMHSYKLDEKNSNISSQCEVENVKVYVCEKCNDTYEEHYVIYHEYQDGKCIHCDHEEQPVI